MPFPVVQPTKREIEILDRGGTSSVILSEGVFFPDDFARLIPIATANYFTRLPEHCTDEQMTHALSNCNNTISQAGCLCLPGNVFLVWGDTADDCVKNTRKVELVGMVHKFCSPLSECIFLMETLAEVGFKVERLGDFDALRIVDLGIPHTGNGFGSHD